MEVIHAAIDFLLEMSASWGYWGIIFLMTIESSFVPFPSELVIPPAAYIACTTGAMNLWLVILAGVFGSVVGALINYYLAMWLGRPVVYGLVRGRFGKVFLISEAKLKKAEDLFLKYGNISTFVGRLIFGVRQLISLPAGFVKMPLGNFILYTALGAGLWMPILAMHGCAFALYQDWILANWWWLLLCVFVAVVLLYFLWRRYKAK